MLQGTLVVIRPIIPSAVTTWWWSNGWVSITWRSFRWSTLKQKSILPRDSKVVYYFKHTKIQKIKWYPYPTMCIYQILIFSYICSRNLFKKERVLNTGTTTVLFWNCLDYSRCFCFHIKYRIMLSHDLSKANLHFWTFLPIFHYCESCFDSLYINIYAQSYFLS